MAQCVHHVGREPTRFPERTFSNSIAFGSSRLGFPNIQMRFSPVGLRGSGKSNQGSFQASGGQRHTSSLSTETASTSSRLTGRPPPPPSSAVASRLFRLFGFFFFGGRLGAGFTPRVELDGFSVVRLSLSLFLFQGTAHHPRLSARRSIRSERASERKIE